MHELIAKGAAAVRRRKGWTQEQAARAYRYHGLTTWRTSTVGSLEAGLRRPKLDEVVLMCAALETTLADLIRAADEDGGEEVGLGDGALMSTRVIRGYIYEGFEEIGKLPGGDPRAMFWFPGEDKVAEGIRRSRAEEDRLRPVLEPIVEWCRQRDHKLMSGDYVTAFHPPSEADRHAARRLGVEPAVVRLAARVKWQRDFAEERDNRVGDVEELEPRSRQAQRGLVTRAMLTELREFLASAGVAGGAAEDDS
jgi:transcriptional regulator with XRE-family HTH domain